MDFNKIPEKSGVYKICNKITGKYYIGRSINLRSRIKRHIRELNKNEHHSIYLQRAWNNFDIVDFKIIIIKFCDLEESIKLEQYYLDNDRENLYNISFNATGGDILSTHPDRENIINKITHSINEKINSMTDEEKKEKWAKYGENNPNYNNKWTDEQKLKASNEKKKYYKNNSQINKDKTFEEIYGEEKAKEMKNNLSNIAKEKKGNKNPFYGKKHSEKTKEINRQKHLGKKPPNRRKVEINGRVFDSLADASKALNIPAPTIHWRIKKGIEGYKYA